MKILNIMQCTNLGGMEQASLLTMKGLIQQGHECRVLSLNPVGALGPSLNAAGIPSEGLQYRGRGGWRSFPRLRSRLQAANADALIMTGHNVGAMLAMLGIQVRHQILAIHFHHTGVLPEWQWRLIYRLACRQFSAITFPSDFIRKEAIAIYPPVEHIGHVIRNAVVPPPVTTNEERDRARCALGIPLAAKVVGNAGWLIPRKRFDIFLRVAASVVQQVSEAVFLIAGDGPERTNLETLSRELGIAQKVKWLGWQADLTSFRHAIDALLFNADWDAMPMTPIEAMASAKPVIASVLHSGLGEVLDTSCGYLIRQHDVDLLANELCKVLQDSSRATALGTAARERVKQSHSLDTHTEQIEQLLRLPIG